MLPLFCLEVFILHLILLGLRIGFKIFYVILFVFLAAMLYIIVRVLQSVVVVCVLSWLVVVSAAVVVARCSVVVVCCFPLFARTLAIWLGAGAPQLRGVVVVVILLSSWFVPFRLLLCVAAVAVIMSLSVHWVALCLRPSVPSYSSCCHCQQQLQYVM